MAAFWLNCFAKAEVAPIIDDNIRIAAGAGVFAHDQLGYRAGIGLSLPNGAMVDASAGQANKTWHDGSESITKMSVKMSYRLGGYGYLRVGPSYKTARRVWGPDIASQDLWFEQQSNSFGVALSFGQQFSFGRLLLGCDWVGMFVPLLSTTSIVVSDERLATSLVGSRDKHSRRNRKLALFANHVSERDSKEWEQKSLGIDFQYFMFSLGVVL